MNSFSRSGETLFSRSLNAHNDIASLHQLLNKKDERKEHYDVFNRIKESKPDEIELTKEEKSIIGIKQESYLLVKNAIFEMDTTHYGFLLVRNPFSVYASYKKLVRHIEPRSQMRRWAENIDKHLLPVLEMQKFVDAFCSLYLRKIDQCLALDLPIIYYEKFVQNPQETLKSLLDSLSLPFDKNVLTSHLNYGLNQKGHGGIILDQPIHANKSNILPDISDDEKSIIYGYTSSLLKKLSYQVNFKKNTISITN